MPTIPTFKRIRVTERRMSILCFICCILCFLYWSFQYGAKTDASRESNLKQDDIIFIGGHESSGTGLARIMLDAHPLIRCGAEPMVSIDLIHARLNMDKARIPQAIAAGIFPEAYDEAVAAFIVKLVEKMGPSAQHLCHKEPQSFAFLDYLAKIFPRAKFVHMLRDGRGAIASSIERGFNRAYNKNDPWGALRMWEETVMPILRSCQKIGPNRCITVRYENLVLNPKDETVKLFKFLNIPWDSIVLRHETILENLTHLNPYEASTKQFVKAIHRDSLVKWLSPESVLPRSFILEAGKQNKALHELGYTECGLPPAYELLNSNVPSV